MRCARIESLTRTVTTSVAPALYAEQMDSASSPSITTTMGTSAPSGSARRRAQSSEAALRGTVRSINTRPARDSRKQESACSAECAVTTSKPDLRSVSRSAAQSLRSLSTSSRQSDASTMVDSFISPFTRPLRVSPTVQHTEREHCFARGEMPRAWSGTYAASHRLRACAGTEQCYDRAHALPGSCVARSGLRGLRGLRRRRGLHVRRGLRRQGRRALRHRHAWIERHHQHACHRRRLRPSVQPTSRMHEPAG